MFKGLLKEEEKTRKWHDMRMIENHKTSIKMHELQTLEKGLKAQSIQSNNRENYVSSIALLTYRRTVKVN